MADGQAAAADKLKAACHAAFHANPHSCSNAVWAVVRALVDAEFAYLPANALIDAIDAAWAQVDVSSAAGLAARGEVVVGGRKDRPNGHVVIVYPGPAKPGGGYAAANHAGERYVLRPRGLYPLAMSTSLGNWPGARSDGDKTVWDPWADDDAFRDVRFWHRRRDDAGSEDAEARHAPIRMTLSNGDVIEIP